MKSEQGRMNHELKTIEEKTKDNTEKIKLNRQLPHLVANVSEILELEPEDEDDDGGAQESPTRVLTNQSLSLPADGVARSLKRYSMEEIVFE